jgi:hypothetical protein
LLKILMKRDGGKTSRVTEAWSKAGSYSAF